MNENDTKELESLFCLVWSSPSMVKHSMENYRYTRIGSLFVDLGDRKPTIKSTMYYDDEREAPGTDIESFKFYNRHLLPSLFPAFGLRASEPYFTIHYNNDKTGGRIVSVNYIGPCDPYPPESIVRKVEPDELKELNSVRQEMRDDFTKRLESYYRKYSAKISTVGYWANR